MCRLMISTKISLVSIWALPFIMFYLLGIISGSVWTRITSLLVIIDLNPTKVEMKISNFIPKDGECIERTI